MLLLLEPSSFVLFHTVALAIRGQTSNFKVSDYLSEMERFIGEDIFDYILVNNQKPPEALIELYAEEGDLVVND